MTDLYLKARFAVRWFRFQSPSALEIVTGGDHYFRIDLRAPTGRESTKAEEDRDMFLEVTGRFSVTKKASPVFVAVEEGRKPRIGETAASLEELTRTEGPDVHRKYYPHAFGVFVDGVYEKLSSEGERVLSLIRWRYALEGIPKPLSLTLGNFSFSRDGKRWTHIPGRYGVATLLDPSIPFRTDEISGPEIERLAHEVKEEPLPHELIREAVDLKSSNRRSAIIIAVSALEVAAKETISILSPKSRWLVDNIQSPPVEKILTKYIPSLLDENTSRSALKLQERTVESLRKAVTIRNNLVHRGEAPPKFDTVNEILAAIKTTLWVCDFWQGNTWAREHLKRHK